jgi:hypothetical protein
MPLGQILKLLELDLMQIHLDVKQLTNPLTEPLILRLTSLLL